jgi:hypothetical protein
MIKIDPDFATAIDYANAYRELGMQVVPALSPSDNRSWKRPAISTWRDLQHALVDDETFLGWYGPKGSHVHHENLGVICGPCSGHLICVDVDEHKQPEAALWFSSCVEGFNSGQPFRTATQRTGGGGKQYFFKYRQGYAAPTIKTSIGVDIRGAGGFAMLPASMHESGKAYEWVTGLEPWSVGFLEAPEGLLAEVFRLATMYGGMAYREPGEGVQRTVTPEYVQNPFGRMTDGREGYMTRLVWAHMVSMHRDCPIKPSDEAFAAEMPKVWAIYERKVVSRIKEPGTPNGILLEREGRGISLLQQKWLTAMLQWDEKIAEWASMPPPQRQTAQESFQQTRRLAESIKRGLDIDTETVEVLEAVTQVADDFEGATIVQKPDVYEVLDEKGIMALADPLWLVQGLVIENSLGFIFGAPGCGKSFIALGMALSIATHRELWWDRSIKRSGPVIYIASEGSSDLKYRIKAWRDATDVKAESQFYLIKQTVNFMDPHDREKLLRSIKAVSDRAQTPPVMIVVDTVSRAIPGADENNQADATLFIQTCDLVRETFNCTVLGVHHTSRNGNMRGSTVFEGAGDALIEIQRELGSQVGTLIPKKIKAAEDGWTINFQLRKVLIDPLKAIESLFAEPTMAVVKSNSDWPEASICQAVLTAMKDAWNAGRPWSSHAQTRKEGRYAPVHMSKWHIKQELAEQMLEAWLTEGVVTYEMHSTKLKQKGLKVAETRAEVYAKQLPPTSAHFSQSED